MEKNKSEEVAERKAREARMKRYDEHMNQYGHYSMLHTQKSTERSPILDEILRSGQKLESDYEKRMGPPPPLAPATPSEPANTPLLAPANTDSVSSEEKRRIYMRDLMAKKRAQGKQSPPSGSPTEALDMEQDKG